MTGGLVTYVLQGLIGTFFFLGGIFSVLFQQAASSGTIKDEVLGPLGALAFAMVVIGGLTKYVLIQRKRLIAIEDECYNEKKKETEFLREQLKNQQ